MLCAGFRPALGETAEDGQQAYDAGHYQEARHIWTVLADAGDAQAAFGLGLLNDLGQGLPRNPRRAYGWYLRAAEAGLAKAQFNVAVMCDSGWGMPRNAGQAAFWYAEAAARGDARAAFDMGLLYADGDGVPRNPVEAAAWFRAAARGGIAAATTKLAALDGHKKLQSGAVAPVAPAPLAPLGATALHGSGDTMPVAIVWVAPQQPSDTQYFVQVIATGSAGVHEIFAATSNRSAILITLPHVPAHYAWRVFGVAPQQLHYAASPWVRFELTNAGTLGRATQAPRNALPPPQRG